ncbi:MAG: hypothetical protein AMXMBFR47_10430 [Planctomycetota bacterium]
MRRQSAFTLIELLVVVAIIALLISILLPSLSAAREQGKNAVCLTNLRNMGTALRMYLDDNRSYFPGDHWQLGRNSMITWVPRLLKYLNEERKVYYCPSREADFIWKRAALRFPFPGYDVHHQALGYEPGEMPLRGELPATLPEYFSYGYNGYGGDWLANPEHFGLGGHTIKGSGDEPWQAEIPEKRVKNPSDMIAISDSNGDGFWDTWISPERLEFRAWPGDLHNQGSNFLFADQHVGRFRLAQILKEDEVERRRWNNDNDPHRDRW